MSKELTIDGQVCDEVRNFKYLGSLVDAKKKMNEKIYPKTVAGNTCS